MQLLHLGLTAMCPHGGQVQAIPSQARVRLSGQPALILSDACMIAGCAFMVGPKPQPCVKIQWMMGALRIKIGGQPALLKTSMALCLSADQIPAGPPNVLNCQMRVKGQ